MEQAIRADERAKSAHERLDRHDSVLAKIQEDISFLRDAVTKLNAKVAIAAGLASLLGSGIVALAVKYL